MKAVVFTLGCKVNSCESDSLIKGLFDLGYEVSNNLEFADLYIINTCAVTNEAEKKSRQAISRARKFNKNAKIIVTGCASEKSPEDFLSKENVKLVTGAKAKGKILNMLDEEGLKISTFDSEYDELLPVKNMYIRAYIKIQDGCNNFCSYCIIPYLRGRSRSRKIASIVKEVQETNAQEIVLTGINISSYNDNGKRLIDLLEALKNTTKRIRLGSLEENIIDDNLLKTLKTMKNFAPHFHLSLQSGSDNILKDMNRKYTTTEFLHKCKLIKKYFENSAITTDVISGYPTETEQDFENTINFIQEAEFSQIHCFSFSKRTGTKAALLKELPDSVKNKRYEILFKKAEEMKNMYLQNSIGNVYDVLFEEKKDGFSIGYTENYIRVFTKGSFEGIIKVKIFEIFKDGVKGQLIKE